MQTFIDKLTQNFIEDDRYMYLVKGLGNTLIIKPSSWASLSVLAMAEIFDEAGNYRSAVAGQAYDRAMVHLLEQPQAYYNTVSCRVELTLTRDGWKIVPTRNLITALSGKLG